MIDADTCECRNGPNWSHDVSPWYEAGESLIVHAPIRLMNSTVLMNLEYLSGDNLWGKYLIDNVDIINVLVADNGYAQWNQSARRDFDFSENLTHSIFVSCSGMSFLILRNPSYLPSPFGE